jgi:uncharacterized protein (TIGR03435 family)
VRHNKSTKAALIAGLALACHLPSRAQTSTPRFEVASIKLCENNDPATEPGGSKGGRGGAAHVSPESFYFGCRTLETLIQFAYLGFPSGQAWVPDPTGFPSPPISMRQLLEPLKGVPAWVSSAKYTIVAKSSTPQTEAMMRGPMMQALLEDRFHLRVHRETRQAPVYLLTVAKSGAKLKPAAPGSCIPFDPDHKKPFVPGQPPSCGWFRVSPQHESEDTYGQTMEGISREFSGQFDRDVIDRTGISGRFDIHLDIPNGPATPPDDELFATIAAALEKVGLQLKAGSAPAVFLVVDHVERPSEN